MQAFKDFLQGSSTATVPYKVMDMENLVQDAIADIPEDDGPHTSAVEDPINFQTVDYPEKYINQPNSEGNRENAQPIAKRNMGKPFKSFRKRNSYGVEDLSGAVAAVANESAQLAELKRKTLASYVKKAATDLSHNAMHVGSKVALKQDKDETHNLSMKYMHKRVKGIKRASEKLAEKLTKNTPTDEVISDFVHSKNKRFVGKSKKERIRMALGAKYAMAKEDMDKACWKGYKAYGMKKKDGKEVPNCVPVQEGSARGGYTRKGIYAKKHSDHVQAAAQSEKSRGVEQKPTTDARKYSWTHLQGYNKGPDDFAAEKKRAASLKKPKKKIAVKLPVTNQPGNSRMADILNHPHYKKLAAKHA